MESFLRSYADHPLQTPMDAAVVIPSLLRPTLRQAVQSVFAQDFGGRIHILIGIDKPDGDPRVIEAAIANRPSHCTVQVFYPGYSTSVRHGGVMPAGDGGALRGILTNLANTPYVAYLDDDNWYGKLHLKGMRAAIEDHDWAWALRWFVHPVSRRTICLDRWESVGPGQGVYNKAFGGFVDTNCFMINKLKCPPVAQQWNVPTSGHGKGGCDRSVFAMLAKYYKWRASERVSVFYKLNPNDPLHQARVKMIGQAYADAEPQITAPVAVPPLPVPIYHRTRREPARKTASAAAEMPVGP